MEEGAGPSGEGRLPVLVRPAHSSSLRIISWNVNSIRATLKLHNNKISRLLEDLGADIACLQETKLRRCDLTDDLAVVDGWDAFFAFAQSPRPYSGVATYVRSSLALPRAAEEGFTGCCGGGGLAGAATAGAGGAGACLHPALAEKYTVEELQELDSEGRVVITDHGAFVLFNIYGPAITAEDEDKAAERIAFKLKFYQALECRWADYLQQGRAVVAVGDFNIKPGPLDTPEPEPNFFRPSRPERLWLRSLLSRPEAATSAPGAAPPCQPLNSGSSGPHPQLGASGRPGAWRSFAPGAAALGAAPAGPGPGAGPRPGVMRQAEGDEEMVEAASGVPCSGSVTAGRFTDAFRAFHPRRKGAYTCWRLATGARANNYGARIDLALTAGVPVGAAGAGTAGAGAGAAAAGAVDAWGAELRPGPQAQQQQQQQARFPLEQSQQQRQQQQLGRAAGSALAAGAAEGGCSIWLSGSDILSDQQGSDHAPVWVDISYQGRFPCAAVAPPTAARYLFSGKQTTLRRFLSAARSSAGPAQQAQQGGEGSREATPPVQPGAEGLAGGATLEAQPSDGPRQPLRSGNSAGGRGCGSGAAASVKPGGGSSGAAAGKKQASLRGFFLPPAAPSSSSQQAQQQDSAAGGPGGSASSSGGWPPLDSAAVSAAPSDMGTAAAGSMDWGNGAEGPQGGWGADSSLAGPGRVQAGAFTQGGAGGSSDAGSGGGGLVSKAAAADQWRKIQQRMAAPKCKHGEEAALKKVNKTGPNKGRYFYSCARPAGPPPHGQCNFFVWLQKRPGDFPSTSGGAGGAKRPKGP